LQNQVTKPFAIPFVPQLLMAQVSLTALICQTILK